MNHNEKRLVPNGKMPAIQLHQMAAQAWSEGRRSEAIDILESILQEHPDNAWIMGEMGGLLVEMGRRGAGSALLGMACIMEQQVNLEDWRHWSTLGSTFEALERRDLAERAFENAVRVDPNVSEVYDQWSGVYVNAGQPQRCVELARKALSLKPGNKVAMKHLSLGLLELGQWEEAWPMMEARKDIKDYTRPKYDLPEWRGEEVDTLIVHGEQGIGDELMYASLVKRIRHLARRMIVEVTPRLVPLIRRSLAQIDCEVYGSMDEVANNGGLDQVKTKDDNAKLSFIRIEGAPDSGMAKPAIVACASIPGILNLRRDQARSDGFLLPDAARVNYWSERLRLIAGNRPIIGLAWEGGVRKTHKRVRNPPFALFEKLVADHGDKALFVSVQYTHGEIENKRLAGTVHFQQAIDDLDEQAALVSACDMIASVPQTVVHIAGAMAVPTVAIVSSCPRWDFCSADDTMPWWSSVKLVYQHSDDWPTAFARFEEAVLRRAGIPRERIKHEVSDASQAVLPAAQ